MNSTEIINTVLASVGLLLNLILIFTITNDRRSITKTKVLLLNYSVSDFLGGCVLIPGYAREFVTPNFLCAIDSGEILYLVSGMLILFAFTLECVMELRARDFLILLALIWSLSLFICVLFACGCYIYSRPHPMDIIIVTIYVTIFSLTLFKFFYGCFKNSKNNTRATLVAVYMLASSVNMGQLLGFSSKTFGVFVWLLQPLKFIFPAIFIVYLYLVDKHVRMLYSSVFRCGVQRAGAKSTANIALEDSDADKFSVDICYSRENQDIAS